MRLTPPQRDMMRTLKWRPVSATVDDTVLGELKALGLADCTGVGAAREWRMTAAGAELVAVRHRTRAA